MPTASEIALGRQTPLTQGIFMSVLTETPLFSAFDARTITGTRFMTLALDALPSSAFANYGQGFTSSDAKLSIREFDCAFIGGLIKAERVTEERWNAEHQAAGYTWFDLQTLMKMKADLLHVESQILYGTAVDAKGFPGLKEITPYGTPLALTGDPSANLYKTPVINAGGTTANTASSVYSICFGDMDAQLIIGGDSGGELIKMGQIITQMLAPDVTNYPTQLSEHHVAQVDGHIGLAVSGFSPSVANQTVPTQYAVRRIANLTAETNHTLNDAMMNLLSLSHGPAKRPNLFSMSLRSGLQLAASRAATQVNFLMGANGSGDAKNATFNIQPPPPDNWQGIPIVYPITHLSTDAIEA